MRYYYHSRRSAYCMAAMVLASVLIIAGIGMEMANPARRQPMAGISLACGVTGLIGGITAYVVNRWD